MHAKFYAMRFLISFLLFVGLSQNIWTQDYNKYGIENESAANLVPLEVGSVAPDFKAKDQFGNMISLSEMTQDGPVLIIFYRGYWCGICQKNLSEFQEEFSSLSSAGVQVLAIAPEVESNIDKTIDQNSLQFSVIADADNSIMESYHVAFNVTQDYQDKVVKYFDTTLEEINGQEDPVLPVPATYLINTDGTIKYVHHDINYGNRATVKDILNQL